MRTETFWIKCTNKNIMPILVCLFLVFLSNPVLAVDCSPADITLSTQEEVNDFQANHGLGCDTIVSSLTITGITINDLTPLSGLMTAGWNSKFMINGTALTSLALTGVLKRPAHSDDDQSLAFNSLGEGLYEAEVAAFGAGAWDIALRAENGLGETFDIEARIIAP